MAALANALHHQREAELTRNENLLASQWQGQLPASSDPTGGMIGPFIAFCNERKVRYCPATPFTVAAYVEGLKGLGIGGIPDLLQAVAELHDQCAHSNPVSTHPVRLALEELATNTQAPRSWLKEEKQLSWPLPADVRIAIARRDQQRERELRRMQNELAETKRKTGDAEKVAETLKKELEEMAKKEGRGFTKEDEKAAGLTRVDDFAEASKSIVNKVESNASTNDGFSGGLKSGRG